MPGAGLGGAAGRTRPRSTPQGFSALASPERNDSIVTTASAGMAEPQRGQRPAITAQQTEGRFLVWSEVEATRTRRREVALAAD